MELSKKQNKFYFKYNTISNANKTVSLALYNQNMIYTRRKGNHHKKDF